MRSSAVVTSLVLGSSITYPRVRRRSAASFDSRMVAIRIDNEPELKIEDAMQVKGRHSNGG